jgi:hypothetical protein
VVGVGSVQVHFFVSSRRTVFLRLASLLVLLFSLSNQITCGGDREAEACKTCGYNYKELPVRMLWVRMPLVAFLGLKVGPPYAVGNPGSLGERSSWVVQTP